MKCIVFVVLLSGAAMMCAAGFDGAVEGEMSGAVVAAAAERCVVR